MNEDRELSLAEAFADAECVWSEDGEPPFEDLADALRTCNPGDVLIRWRAPSPPTVAELAQEIEGLLEDAVTYSDFGAPLAHFAVPNPRLGRSDSVLFDSDEVRSALAAFASVAIDKALAGAKSLNAVQDGVVTVPDHAGVVVDLWTKPEPSFEAEVRLSFSAPSTDDDDLRTVHFEGDGACLVELSISPAVASTLNPHTRYRVTFTPVEDR